MSIRRTVKRRACLSHPERLSDFVALQRSVVPACAVRAACAVIA